MLAHVLKEWWGLYIRLFNKYRCSETTRLLLVCLHIKPFLSAHGLWFRVCLELTQAVLLSLQQVYDDDIMEFTGEVGREIHFSPLLRLARPLLWIHFTFHYFEDCIVDG